MDVKAKKKRLIKGRYGRVERVLLGQLADSNHGRKRGETKSGEIPELHTELFYSENHNEQTGDVPVAMFDDQRGN